jgi:hypothetical protein
MSDANTIRRGPASCEARGAASEFLGAVVAFVLIPSKALTPRGAPRVFTASSE